VGIAILAEETALEAAANMRRVESDLAANRYNTALRRKDILLDRLAESRALLEGEMHLEKDTSAKPTDRLDESINDVMSGQLPPVWSEALKEYYRKLAEWGAICATIQRDHGRTGRPNQARQADSLVFSKGVLVWPNGGGGGQVDGLLDCRIGDSVCGSVFCVGEEGASRATV
jgi:hypothetical protein